jgi:hypothetical protein
LSHAIGYYNEADMLKSGSTLIDLDADQSINTQMGWLDVASIKMELIN